METENQFAREKIWISFYTYILPPFAINKRQKILKNNECIEEHPVIKNYSWVFYFVSLNHQLKFFNMQSNFLPAIKVIHLFLNFIGLKIVNSYCLQPVSKTCLPNELIRKLFFEGSQTDCLKWIKTFSKVTSMKLKLDFKVV